MGRDDVEVFLSKLEEMMEMLRGFLVGFQVYDQFAYRPSDQIR